MPASEARILANVERMAVLLVRMERAVAQETSAISGRVRRARADFVALVGLDEGAIAVLRPEAGDLALFDPSREACLARMYEAAQPTLTRYRYSDPFCGAAFMTEKLPRQSQITPSPRFTAGGSEGNPLTKQSTANERKANPRHAHTPDHPREGVTVATPVQCVSTTSYNFLFYHNCDASRNSHLTVKPYL